MKQEHIDMRITAVNLDAHASQMAMLGMLSRRLNIPVSSLREEFAELKDAEMERLLIQLENADPAFAAELSAIEERTALDSSRGSETEH